MFNVTVLIRRAEMNGPTGKTIILGHSEDAEKTSTCLHIRIQHEIDTTCLYNTPIQHTNQRIKWKIKTILY